MTQEDHRLAKCLCNERDNFTIISLVDGNKICRCNSCGQVYVKGRDDNFVQFVYDESNYFTERNEYLKKQDELAGRFQKILDTAKPFKSTGAFLDVGCSVGIFLEIAQQNGFEAKGVEFSTWASEFARQNGLDVVTGGVADAHYPEKSFDVVVLNHVLEHIPQPVGTLAEVRRILKDDGLIIIGVPNFGSYMAKLMKRKWFSLMPDQHIWQFTHETLGNLLRRVGFVEVYFEAKDNHAIVGWRPIKVLQRLVNFIGVKANNAEAMLLFARKARND